MPEGLILINSDLNVDNASLDVAFQFSEESERSIRIVDDVVLRCSPRFTSGCL